MKEDFFIKKNWSIKDAMKQMNKTGEKILFAVDDDNSLLGSLTDGDVRRWILKEGKLTDHVDKIYNKNPIFVTANYGIENVKQLMLKNKIEWIPVLGTDRKIIEVLLWNNIFGDGVVVPKEKLSMPMVIMAGGKGERLDPFTRILPKPLIPIGERPIIDIIMDKFSQYGITEFYISINHKARMIKFYFEETNTAYNIHYLEEREPLGTAGSLRFLKGRLKGSFFVTNCDIIINCDYAEIARFHAQNDYDLTMVGAFRHHTIPYGICEIKKGGILKTITEKPEYDFIVNTGMYILKSNVLRFIPKNTLFHMTNLVQEIRKNNGKIGVFPVAEKSWIDVGQWEEYKKSIANMKES